MTTLDDWTGDVHAGDAFDVLPDLPDESVHACITDPPYGLAFMGRDWDDFEPREYQDWAEEWSREVRRVLKPGGHLLAFSGNRTHHRLFTGVEDAGFEIRDTLTWHYGSGFPKAADVSKTIDKRADAEREVVGEDKHAADRSADIGYHGDVPNEGRRKVTEPATDAAKKWNGWKTGLKPATEFVVLARKPYDGATVDSVLENGTGALNIDACRIENDIDEVTTTTRTSERNQNDYGEAEQSNIASASPEGRYPANVVFDETAADALDREVGELDAGARTPQTNSGSGDIYGEYGDETRDHERQQLESGGPSRYFYTSKASRSERTDDGAIENDHPTVKPVDLMKWLVKLVTREDQVVLDPFAGSGTTAVAAKDLGREFVAIERQAKYVSLAQARIGIDVDDPSVVREADAAGLDDFA